jgi:hypothetical protein
MSKYLMQAVSGGVGGDGTLKAWSAGTPDWAAAGFPGPGTALYTAVRKVIRDDVLVTAGNGTELGRKIEWDGAAWVQKRGWIQPTVDVTGSASGHVNINAALASRDGACVELPEGTIKITSPLTLGLNGLTLLGRGDYGTTLVLDGAANQDWIVMGALAQRLKNIRIVRATMPSATPSGYAVRVTSAFGAKLEQLWLENTENGIHVQSATDTVLREVKLRNIFGSIGLLMRGTGAVFGNQTLVDGMRTDNPYPLAYPAVADIGNWAATTAVSLGEIVVVASVLCWQCTTAGTTAATNSTLTSLPSTDPALARSTAVANGSASFKFVGRADLDWAFLDSYGGDLEMRSCALLNGGTGFRWDDTVTSGGAGLTSIVTARDVKIDHPLNYGARLERGFDADLQLWASSCLMGPGVVVGGNFGTDWHIHDGSIFGNATRGILVSAAGHGEIVNNRVGLNGQLANNTYDGIETGTVIDMLINSNRSGDIRNSSANPQRYGISVGAGSTYYGVQGNWVRGNQTGGVSHPSGTGAQVANNVS